jgi:NADPH:quinone reductase-like Zn-dependent oxidoreductase
MRAMATDRYGPNEVLELSDLPDPKLGPDTLIVRTRCVGLNPVDWKIIQGRLDGRFPSHFPLVPCCDVAGVIEAVGPAVTSFEPGQEVMAYDREDHIQWGTLAELVSVPVRCATPKPAGVGWVEAAALPLAGLTAYQCIHDAVGVTASDTVLIHAASGGVGSFAVQLAARTGARVIGTSSPRNHDHLRSLGAEPVAYGDGLVKELRALAPEGVDAVVDLVGGPALATTPDVLKPDGRVVSITDAAGVQKLGGRYVFVHPDAVQLAELGRLVAEGALTVPIAATFPFERSVEALTRVEEGHTRGKMVVELPEDGISG